MKQPPRRDAGSRRIFNIILVVVLVAGVAALSVLSARSGGRVTQLDSVVPIPNQGHVIGSDTAPIEVVEFGDFECPACGNFANLTEPDIRARLVNTGVVRFRFVDFPLRMHANTRTAHMAAWCAGDQGKFWEMHDLIYQNQDRWSGEATGRPAGVLEDLARQTGINMEQYGSCMDDGKFAAQIKANEDEAMRRGIPSTPTFIIGNQQVSSAIPYDEFKTYVDRALAQRASGSSTKTATKAAPGR